MKVNKNFLLKSETLSSAAFFTFLRMAIRMISPIIIMPYIYPILGPSNVGDINWALSFINISILISSLGLFNYSLKYVSSIRKEYNKLEEFVNQIIAARLFVSIIFIFIITIFLLIFYSQRSLYVFILLFFLISEILGSEWIYFSYQKQKYIAIRFFISQILFLISIFISFHYFPDPVTYIIVFTIINSIYNLINFKAVYSEYTLVKIDFGYFKNLISNGLNTHLISILIAFFGKIDLIIIGFFLSKEVFGIISADYKIIMVLTVAVTTLSMVSLPKSSKNNMTNNFESFSMRLIDIKLLITTIGIIFTYTNAAFIINNLFGVKFADGILFLKLTSPLILIFVINNYLTWNILYIKTEPLKIINHLLPGIIIFVVSVPFISYFNQYIFLLVILYISNFLTFYLLYNFSKKIVKFKILNKNHVILLILFLFVCIFGEIIGKITNYYSITYFLILILFYLFVLYSLKYSGLIILISIAKQKIAKGRN